MFQIQSKLFFKLFTSKDVMGMAIFPFIIFRHPADARNRTFMLHERIHLRQQVELLILPFFIWYVCEFLIRLIQYRSLDLAYRNISFEREAYANEQDRDYLAKRRAYQFMRYLNRRPQQKTNNL